MRFVACRAAIAAMALFLFVATPLEPILAAPRPAAARAAKQVAKPRKPLPKARVDAWGRPIVPAASTVLMDGETGEILFEKAAEVRRPIASTTKILTAIVVLQQADLDKPFRVPATAAKVGESSAQLIAGEKRTPRELLYALLLRSANDAGAALAIHVGGSIKGFSQMMNDKAAEIGAKRTHFSNPHGLTAPRNYSTAGDLALITAYAMKNATFASIVKTKTKKIPWPKHRYPRVFTNHNKLLWRLPGAIGVKTGYTIPAGNCLVAAARRRSTTLIAVSLKSASAEDAYLSTSFLLNWGFSNYKPGPRIEKGKTYISLPVAQLPGVTEPLVAAADAVAKVFGDSAETTISCLVPVEAHAPITKGEAMGEARLVRDGRVVGSVPLLASQTLDAPTLWDRLAAIGLASGRRARPVSTARSTARQPQ